MPKPKLVNNLPLLNRTLAHWSLVENALGEAVVLPDGTTRDGAQDLATSIQETEHTLMTARNTLATLQEERNQVRDRAHTAAKQARKSLRGLAAPVPEVHGLPQVPPKTSSVAVFTAALDDIADVWERVNALPPAQVPAVRLPLRIPLEENHTPLLLAVAPFRDQIEALRTMAHSLAAAEAAVTVGISERDTLHEQAAAGIKSYGAVVRSLLHEGHPLLMTLPTLTKG